MSNKQALPGCKFKRILEVRSCKGRATVQYACYVSTAAHDQFAAIKDVAEFVGSPLSDYDLCCIATEGAKDMGSHTKARDEVGQVTSRFGKWKVSQRSEKLGRGDNNLLCSRHRC